MGPDPRHPDPRRDEPSIVVAGESLVDLLVAPDGGVSAVPGGGPYNVARALGRLGRPVAFLGRLSTDRFGRMLLAGLVADGVDLRLAPTTDDPTLLAVAELDAGGSATYRFHTAGTAAAGLRPEDLAGGLGPAVAAIHVGTLGLVLEPMAGTIAGLVARAPDDLLVMADPNCRPAAIDDVAAYRHRLDRVLRRTDVLKVSTDDLDWLEPGADHVVGARSLLLRGPVVALVTDGPRPVRVVTADRVVEIAVPVVTVADTVGAGDAFGAGFLAAWTGRGLGRRSLDGLDAVVAAAAFAAEVGARTAQRTGADPPTLAELRAAGVPTWPDPPGGSGT